MTGQHASPQPTPTPPSAAVGAQANARASATGPDRCPRCGQGFACGMQGAAPCPCTTVPLAPEQLDALRARYQGCLCVPCLRALAAGAPLDPAFELGPPDLSAWRAGNTGTEGVWHFDSGQPGRRLMVTALVHGNELCGAWALKGLLEAGVRPQRGALTLAFCNLAAFDRFDPADTGASRFVDEDFNRVWQADRLDPEQAAPSAERRRAQALRPFVQQAEWLLDIHSMGSPCAPLQLAGTRQRHLALARRLGAPAHIVVDAGHAEGTRLRDFGHWGLPDDHPEAADRCALLIECGWHGAASSRRVAQDQCARMLVEAGTLDAATAGRLLPGWRQDDAPAQQVLEVVGAVTARTDHLQFTRPVPPLACIPQAGTVIALDGDQPVATPHDDCVLVMPATKPPKAGGTAVRLAVRR